MTTSNTSDSELLRRWRDAAHPRHAGARTRLLARSLGWMRQFLRRRIRSHPVEGGVTDAVQVAAMRTVRYGPPKHDSWFGWAAQLLRHLVYDRHKAIRRSLPEHDSAPSAASIPDPHRDPLLMRIDQEHEDHRRRRIEQEVQRWTPEERLLHDLHLAGTAWAVIAARPEFAGATIDGLRMRLDRCRKRLAAVQLRLDRRQEDSRDDRSS